METRVMKMYGRMILSLLVAAAGSLNAQPLNDSVFNTQTVHQTRLQNAATRKFQALPAPTARQSLQLFIFLSPECPLCQRYSQLLNDLRRQYGNEVQFNGIIPGKTYTSATVNAFAHKYKINFPLLIDPAKQLTNYLQASITPEVVLLNSRAELIYKGAIDNRMKSLGMERWKATENYLLDAISQYLQHGSITLKRTRATGCLINDF